MRWIAVVAFLLGMASAGWGADRFVGDTAIYTEPGPASVPAANVLLLIERGVPAEQLRETLPLALAPWRDRVRVGLMVFGGGGGETGGGLLLPVGDLAGEEDWRRFNEQLTLLPAEENPEESGSALAEALLDGVFYFGRDRQASTAPVSGAEFPASPIAAACQKNIFMVIAPGRVAGAALAERSEHLDLADGDGDGYVADEIAAQAYAGDLAAGLDDRQNVRTHALALTEDDALLRAVAEDGRGLYRNVASAGEIGAALGEMLANLTADAAASFTTPTLSSGAGLSAAAPARIYVSSFQPRSQKPWLGNLKKYAVDGDGRILDRNGAAALCPDARDAAACAGVAAGEFKPGAVAFWSAGEGLRTMEERRLYSNLSGMDDLTEEANAVTSANVRPERLGLRDAEESGRLLAYLRGADAYDEDGDGLLSETRDWVLGDLLHARPTVVPYRRFPPHGDAESDPAQNRTLIFVGGNDGMLHAFRDADGAELWAFIPEVLLPELAALAGVGHGYYVDGTAVPFIYDRDGDGNIGPGPEQEADDRDPAGMVDNGADDRVVLLFGLRRGGGAYYALDVTVPERPKFLWKFDRDTVGGDGRPLFPELGESWSEPRLARLRLGGMVRDVAFIGAGYDVAEDGRYGAVADYPQPNVPGVGAGPTTSPGQVGADQAIARGRGVYAFAVATRDARGVPLIASAPERVWGWTARDDVRLDRPIPGEIAVLDGDGDGFADRLYAVDLAGRLWRFALAADDPANGSGTLVFAPDPAAGLKAFSGLSLARSGGCWLIAYGSGDRAHPLNTAVTGRFYLIRDQGLADAEPIAESALVDVTGDALQREDSGESARGELLAALLAVDCPGWRISLERLDQAGRAGGEKVLAAPLIFNRAVYFTTYMPDAPEALPQAPCVVGNPGSARLYAVDWRTGEAVLNFHPENDGEGEEAVNPRALGPRREVLRRADRGTALGAGSPGGIVPLLDGGEAELLVGAGEGLHRRTATSGGVIFPLYWRQW
ncbi:MAG: PilC/PilY family type IV pilus protein [Trichloromonas sp.]|jgi:type IV pilus assembly protein PilY1|nr:PilC/PilY family type IV pilus protein [Trichloromonas sp.]